MISNYHGHTIHCKHGIGSTEEHIQSAIKYGLEEVAITEHVPIKGKKLSRIDYEDFEKFITELNILKTKYSDKIKILSGLECKYVEAVFDDHLKLKNKYNIDFLILGHHFSNLNQPGHYYFQTDTYDMVDEYIENTIEAVKTGYFSIFAHPDIFLNKLPMDEYLLEKSKQLLKVCEQYNIVIEINANGIRNNKGYPNIDFWKLASKYNIGVVINADSHAPSEICDDSIQAAYNFANELGIPIIERINFNENKNN